MSIKPPASIQFNPGEITEANLSRFKIDRVGWMLNNETTFPIKANGDGTFSVDFHDLIVCDPEIILAILSENIQNGTSNPMAFQFYTMIRMILDDKYRVMKEQAEKERKEASIN